MSQPIVLIVDDEKNTRDGLNIALTEEFDCYVASDLTQAKSVLESESIDVLITDLKMGGESGMDLLLYAQSLKKPPVSIMMTAYGSVDTAVEAMRLGAWHFVTKPLNLDEVELLIKRAAKGRKIENENELLVVENKTLKATLGEPPQGANNIIGHSAAIKKVHDIIQQVAPTKATILIEGESGTGKEVIAKSLHQLSERSRKKMITVNCAALSPQLLESELFGHEKGAYTGATQRRIGRFEEANGGTLFLDEIGEIDPSTQVKLLRAISERTIERVGSNTPIHVDVRIVTATNKNLTKMVEEETFREDLYFRLNVVKIDIPPLRLREDDVVILAHTFLKEFSEENQKTLKPLSNKALNAIRLYQWPGNVRELKTCIEHGVIMSNEDKILLRHLPQRIIDQTSGLTILQTHPEKKLSKSDILIESTAEIPLFNLAELEKQTIKRALEQTNGNRTEAAKLLGISRRTLHRKLPPSLSNDK